MLVSQYTDAFVAVSGLPTDAVIASDKLNNSIFYGASASSFYLSVDGAKTFTAEGSLGSSTAPVKVVVNPNITGDVWVSTDKGLFHSTNSGTSFTAVTGPTQAWAIALGAPAKSGGYPAVFAAAIISSVTGYFRSDDGGVNWIQINDATHGFGATAANVLTADPRIYGRCVSCFVSNAYFLIIYAVFILERTGEEYSMATPQARLHQLLPLQHPQPRLRLPLPRLQKQHPQP